ncbi:sensor domain-containing phosphodiesterase [Luteimonas sp. MC1750]|nr:sensor domain-containing phosphodiesterase [Luteimonas sp. MC1750]QQO05996.1 sensor domain-containing phosphodiesterase [Luteimonas sp. MC1750]
MSAMQERCAAVPPDVGNSARRHNQALVALARQCWTGLQSLEWALARICETAAEVLEVDRVNVWRLHPAHGVLRCIHAYDRHGGAHDAGGYGEALDADCEYGRRLDEVRVIDAIDVHRDPGLATLQSYFERYRVASLLDAPVRGEGALLGVVCHEQVGRARAWSEADQAFAASIGDCVAMVIEIHRRHDAERRLRYLELHDPQTNLPNRDHLLEVAHSALCPAGSGEPAITAIHLQVEPGEGDRVANLVAVAAALRAGFGEDATLARVRDDAFALVPHRSLRGAEALELAGRCVELAERAGRGGERSRVVAGIAFSHDLAAPSADMLLRNAELASHRARSLGRLDRCEVFDAGRHRELMERMRLERELREAHEKGRLHVHYQPVVRLADGRAIGAEALLRWRDDGGRWRPTAEFIDVAETSGLIVPLGRWLLGTACATAAAWPAEAGPLTLAVNVSARQLEQPGLVGDVAAALDASGLAPARLWLELTETALLADAPFAIATLQRLRELGVRVALDDFGTGQSSLARLKQLPIDGLKVDRGFVADLPGDPLDMAILAAIATVGARARLQVVAEGVETAAQARAVMDCGIAYGQGFHYARPMPEADLRSIFTRAG